MSNYKITKINLYHNPENISEYYYGDNQDFNEIEYELENGNKNSIKTWAEVNSYTLIEEIDNLQQLIGKTIIDIKHLEEIDCYNWDPWDTQSTPKKCDLYEIQTVEGFRCKFHLINYSQGYYKGGCYISNFNN